MRNPQTQAHPSNTEYTLLTSDSKTKKVVNL